MKVLLVSDPEAKVAAASLTIGVGSSSEPEERPGLAHFLEHMLFMGTRKYPGDDEYPRFIQGHGGGFNAETAWDWTRYYFSIDPPFFDEALDRFSQFFIAPLFDVRFVDRERHAVDAEYLLKLKNGALRAQAALKQAYNLASPYSRFTVGNLQTLADRPGNPVRDDLVAFYEQHYSANLMGLALVGPQPLDELEGLVKRYFRAVPDRGRRRYAPGRDEKALPGPLLPQGLMIEPLSAMTELHLIFPVAPQRPFYKVNPGSYLVQLFTNGQPHGLYATLKERGWISGISVSSEDLDRGQGRFIITVGLTDSGRGHVDEITHAIYAYIDLLRKEALIPWRYQEQQRMDELGFRFREKESPVDYAVALSQRLLDYPARDLLRADVMLQEFDARVIKRLLDQLVPEHATRVLIAPGVTTDRKAPWYGTAYRLVRPDVLPPAKTAFHFQLPGRNPFIPGSLGMKTDSQGHSVPTKLIDEPGFVVWHDLDADWGEPRAEFRARLRSPLAMRTVDEAMLQQLLVLVVGDGFLPVTQQAKLAGLDMSLEAGREGLALHVLGYDDKLPLLVSRIAEALARPSLDEARFVLARRALEQSLLARRQNTVADQAMEALNGSLFTPYYTPGEQLAALKKLTLSDLRAYAKKFFARIGATVFIHGNLDAGEARRLAEDFRQRLLAGSRLMDMPAESPVLPEQGDILRKTVQVDQPDSAWVQLFTDEDTSARAHARWLLLAGLMGQPFHTELRTRQQLGYLVSASYASVKNHPALMLVLQSANTPGEKLGWHVQTFLEGFSRSLASLDEAALDNLKQALSGELRAPDTSFSSRGARFYDDIDNGHPFDFRLRVARALDKITARGVSAFYTREILEAPRSRVAWSAGRFPVQSKGK